MAIDLKLSSLTNQDESPWLSRMADKEDNYYLIVGRFKENKSWDYYLRI